MTNAFQDIEKLESDLWQAADNLRANSKLTSGDDFMIPLNRHFCCYEPPRSLEAIEADIRVRESDIVRMLSEVTG